MTRQIRFTQLITRPLATYHLRLQFELYQTFQNLLLMAKLLTIKKLPQSKLNGKKIKELQETYCSIFQRTDKNKSHERKKEI